MAEVKKKVSRQEKAAATRRRMIDAAYELFCELGYRATTMDAIAERAGVAVQTLYFTFHTKDEMFQEVHERTVLGDEQIPPPMQPWYVAAVVTPDIAAAVHHIANGVINISRRVAPMIPSFHAVVADPAGAVWERAQRLRLDGMTDLVAVLVKKRALRKGMTKAQAADVLYVLLGPDIYLTLVIERGWTEKQFVAWTEQTILRDLFAIVG